MATTMRREGLLEQSLQMHKSRFASCEKVATQLDMWGAHQCEAELFHYCLGASTLVWNIMAGVPGHFSEVRLQGLSGFMLMLTWNSHLHIGVGFAHYDDHNLG